MSKVAGGDATGPRSKIAETIKGFLDDRYFTNKAAFAVELTPDDWRVVRAALSETLPMQGAFQVIKVVPYEPTTAMLEAAGHACDGLNLSRMSKAERSLYKAKTRWAAMLKAAPPQPKILLDMEVSASSAMAALLPLPNVIGPVTEMVQEISALCGDMEGTETNCEVVSCVLNAAKRYQGGERAE